MDENNNPAAAEPENIPTPAGAADPEGAGKENGEDAGDSGVKRAAEFSKADIDKAVKDALSKQEKAFNKRLEAEKKEAVRLAGLDEKQRAEEEKKRSKAEFEKEKAEFARKQLIFDTKEKLSGKKLPTQFAEMLTGTDEEDTDKNIESFESMFAEAVTAAVNERLKGKTPRTPSGGSSGGTDNMNDIIKASIRGGF